MSLFSQCPGAANIRFTQRTGKWTALVLTVAIPSVFQPSRAPCFKILFDMWEASRDVCSQVEIETQDPLEFPGYQKSHSWQNENRVLTEAVTGTAFDWCCFLNHTNFIMASKGTNSWEKNHSCLFDTRQLKNYLSCIVYSIWWSIKEGPWVWCRWLKSLQQANVRFNGSLLSDYPNRSYNKLSLLKVILSGRASKPGRICCRASLKIPVRFARGSQKAAC